VLTGLPVSSRLGAYSVYYGLILAHVAAFYGLGWIAERSAAAILRRAFRVRSV
jgi:hypothetical protein